MTVKNANALIWSIAILGVCLMAGCDKGESLAGKWEYKEISRIKSPDSLVEAVIVTGDAGATTSMRTWVYLVPTNGTIDVGDDDKALFIADHLKNFKVVWNEPKLLEIRYEEARIFKFKNYWQSREVQNFHYIVELKLVPERADFSLPIKDRMW
jgi:hypothetical protein